MLGNIIGGLILLLAPKWLPQLLGLSTAVGVMTGDQFLMWGLGVTLATLASSLFIARASRAAKAIAKDRDEWKRKFDAAPQPETVAALRMQLKELRDNADAEREAVRVHDSLEIIERPNDVVTDPAQRLIAARRALDELITPSDRLSKELKHFETSFAEAKTAQEGMNLEACIRPVREKDVAHWRAVRETIDRHIRPGSSVRLTLPTEYHGLAPGPELTARLERMGSLIAWLTRYGRSDDESQDKLTVQDLRPV